MNKQEMIAIATIKGWTVKQFEMELRGLQLFGSQENSDLVEEYRHSELRKSY